MSSTSRRVRGLAVPFFLVLAVGGCADLGGEPPSGEGARDLPFPSCEDRPTISGDPALYRDTPRYGNAMELSQAVSAWASGVDGFEQLWHDREHHGWVTVGVHDADVDALQDEVAERFPGEGVVVVEVPYTHAELEAVRERAMAALEPAGALPMGGSSGDAAYGVVSLYGVPDTPEARQALAGLAGEPLCVDLVDAGLIAPEGPQPEAGDGWRLLGHEEGAGEAYRTGLATTDDQLAALWSESGLGGAAPEVDWEREVVAWFGAVYGSSCPIRLDGVAVTGDVLHPETVVPGAGPMMACTDDANPHSYVVAVERSLLPEGPFRLQLGPEDPPGGVPQERTVVDVGLSEPGATAADDEIHLDDALIGGPPAPPLVADGHEGPIPNGARYVWHPRPGCTGVVVGPLDGTLWRLADGEHPWEEVDGQELTIHGVDDDVLVISSPGMDYLFVPAEDGTCA